MTNSAMNAAILVVVVLILLAIFPRVHVKPVYINPNKPQSGLMLYLFMFTAVAAVFVFLS